MWGEVCKKKKIQILAIGEMAQHLPVTLVQEVQGPLLDSAGYCTCVTYKLMEVQGHTRSKNCGFFKNSVMFYKYVSVLILGIGYGAASVCPLQFVINYDCLTP